MKAVFISVYLLFAAALAGLAAFRLLTATGSALAWTSLLLLTLPILIFISWAMLRRRAARTSRHLPWVSAPALLGMTILAFSMARGAAHDPALFTSAFAAAVGLLLYLYWYSTLNPPPGKTLEVGARLPLLELENAQAERVIIDPAGSGPLLLHFFRGNWCPFCMASVREYVAVLQEFAGRGIEVSFVSPQPAQRNDALAKEFDAPVRFLTDPALKTSSRLGLVQRFGTPLGLQMLGYLSHTVIPAVILTHAGGRIAYLEIADNYRIRSDPQEILRHLDQDPTMGA